MQNFEQVYCEVDDFCKRFLSEWKSKLLEGQERKRNRESKLSFSELITILTLFQTSGYRTLKQFYEFLCCVHRREFPGLVSYSRFVQLIPRVLVPATAFLQSKMSVQSGVSFIDSTSLAVCKPKRISSNKVFKEVAKLGKTTIGWFYGFKCHIVVSDLGELLAVTFTPGNVDDRNPVRSLTKKLKGKLFGDKGYISKALFEELYERGFKFITGLKQNMQNQLMELTEKYLLRKRSIIETIFDLLKNVCQIEHSRHRSVTNFFVHLTSALAAYTLRPAKPAISGISTLS